MRVKLCVKITNTGDHRVALSDNDIERNLLELRIRGPVNACRKLSVIVANVRDYSRSQFFLSSVVGLLPFDHEKLLSAQS